MVGTSTATEPGDKNLVYLFSVAFVFVNNGKPLLQHQGSISLLFLKAHPYSFLFQEDITDGFNPQQVLLSMTGTHPCTNHLIFKDLLILLECHWFLSVFFMLILPLSQIANTIPIKSSLHF